MNAYAPTSDLRANLRERCITPAIPGKRARRQVILLSALNRINGSNQSNARHACASLEAA